MMCGTKRLNPFFRLHEASEVLQTCVIGVWSDNFTAAFFVSFIVTVFVRNSAVAAHLCPPRNVYNPHPMVKSKKYFDIAAHPEAQWPSQQNILIFSFVCDTTFFSSISKHNFNRTVARKFSVPSRICLFKKGDAS